MEKPHDPSARGPESGPKNPPELDNHRSAEPQTQHRTEQRTIELFDEIPYGDEPIRLTAPDHLAVLARLHGMPVTLSPRFAVLELGCASGHNLLAMASAHPQAQFVGVDLSERQVQQGRQLVAELGVKNVRLEHLDIADVGPHLGMFDFIITHGIFSWVEEPIREQIFRIFADNLAPTGLAYLSYNAMPGGHLRGILKDTILIEAADHPEPGEKVRAARQALLRIAALLEDEKSSYAQLLKHEIGEFQRMPDWFFVHDFLVPAHRAFYLHEIVEKAARHSLQYLCDAEPSSLPDIRLLGRTGQILGATVSDPLRREHYIDVTRNCMFRRTLLCRSEIAIRRPLDPAQLTDLRISASLSAAPGPQPGVIRFTHRNGARIDAADPTLIQCINVLAAAFPRTLALSDIAELIGTPVSEILSRSGASLMRMFMAEILHLHLRRPMYASTVPQRPIVSALARLSAARWGRAPNLTQENVPLNAGEQRLLQLLDGTRTVGEIARRAAVDEAAVQEFLARALRDRLLLADEQ